MKPTQYDNFGEAEYEFANNSYSLWVKSKSVYRLSVNDVLTTVIVLMEKLTWNKLQILTLGADVFPLYPVEVVILNRFLPSKG